ncbi:hypothetical protein [Candidatus Venteria ishoeyi]|uniref:Uncharacterized protein n=1 Tax=Candidatus Venteria ishoeyi TaxID=1899563 RepID=A0A1H6FBC2_9GAMM|nr:hypothetical protein [Candidatus Venteria ishoeyi]MDM8547327.1 hypothetical protein [Candidatus Venteria ishoeyi]SEH05780.1 Uncharacterised protein [Candidatus Venteria ishoeyi]SEH07392.1 Uncharacterised protein [Candidatus Venteria ishoeyi]
MTSSEQPPSQTPSQDRPPATENMGSMNTGQVDRFLQTFERSARRWELVVYPALFAFVVLAGYGFFLIYSLTNSVAMMAHSMDPHMGENMLSMSSNIERMTQDMHTMSATMLDIAVKMDSLPPMPEQLIVMNKTMHAMNTSITQMSTSIHTMTLDMNQMRGELGNMERNISRPMSFFNNFAPW